MDTETGKIVNLKDQDLVRAEFLWRMYEAGLLDKQPRFIPVQNDKVGNAIRKRARRVKRSYKDFCR